MKSVVAFAGWRRATMHGGLVPRRASIGIARLNLHGLLPQEPELLPEAEIALGTTRATLGSASRENAGNFSLCHGESGDAELLIIAADLLNRPELRGQAEAVGIRGIEQYEDQGLPWPCGLPGVGETPNLMLGLAGIGYFLLRLYDEQAVPTVLLPEAVPRQTPN